MKMLTVNRNIRIPMQELKFSFSRSGGPGGQNVNKVNTQAHLRWSVRNSPSLSDEVRQRFINRYRHRVTAGGDLVLSSQRYRNQGRNVADCLEKLRELLLTVAVAPKARKATKPSKGSKARRRRAKEQNSQKKAQRKPPSAHD